MIVLSQKIIEKLVNKLFEDPMCQDACAYREDLLGLVRAAKSEQHIHEAEQLILRPEFRDAFFSIDSMR